MFSFVSESLWTFHVTAILFDCQFVSAASGSIAVADALCRPETTAPSPGHSENHILIARMHF